MTIFDNDEQKVKFYKNKILKRLDSLEGDIQEDKLNYFRGVINNCDDYEELRFLAELDLQIDFIKYTKSDIQDKLAKQGLSLEEAIRLKEEHNDTAELRIVKMPNVRKVNEYPLSNDEVAEALEDDETLEMAANIIYLRSLKEPTSDEQIEALDELDMALDSQEFDEYEADDSEDYIENDELDNDDEYDFEDSIDSEYDLYDTDDEDADADADESLGDLIDDALSDDDIDEDEEPENSGWQDYLDVTDSIWDSDEDFEEEYDEENSYDSVFEDDFENDFDSLDDDEYGEEYDDEYEETKESILDQAGQFYSDDDEIIDFDYPDDTVSDGPQIDFSNIFEEGDFDGLDEILGEDIDEDTDEDTDESDDPFNFEDDIDSEYDEYEEYDDLEDEPDESDDSDDSDESDEDSLDSLFESSDFEDDDDGNEDDSEDAADDLDSLLDSPDFDDYDTDEDNEDDNEPEFSLDDSIFDADKSFSDFHEQERKFRDSQFNESDIVQVANKIENKETKEIKKTTKKKVTADKVFLNGTKRGQETQQMFNFLADALSLGSRVKNTASKKAASGISKIMRSDFLN